MKDLKESPRKGSKEETHMLRANQGEVRAMGGPVLVSLIQ